ncbi:MAG: carboxyl-terminal processing protease CtpB [Cyanobacteria bacterium P01_F01_bin.150]
MSRRFLIHSAIAATSTIMSLLIPAMSESTTAALQNSPKAILDEAWQIINAEYVDPEFNQQDWQAVRAELLSQDYTSLASAYDALRDVVRRLDDPYTRFMDPDKYQELTTQTSGEFSGVGLRLRVPEETGILTVVEALEGSPANQAGITSGDRILAIDGTSTRGMDVKEAADLMSGDVGTTLNLTVDRTQEDKFDVALVRERLELPTVNYALRNEGSSEIGYIRLSEFSAHAAEQMEEAIADLSDQEVDAFVLDLRGNPGGLLRSSIDISRMWLDDGAIVQTVDRFGNSEEIEANHTALTHLPLAVLVDGNSASSSEIVTGALADNERAIVVGHKTFGKALVQAVHSLSDGSGLAVTVAHYYTPDGTDISQLGITPDISVRLTLEQRQTLSSNPNLQGTYADPYYREALEALQPEIFANQRTSELLRSQSQFKIEITE